MLPVQITKLNKVVAIEHCKLCHSLTMHYANISHYIVQVNAEINYHKMHYILLITSEISAQKLSTSKSSFCRAKTLASSVGSSNRDIIPAEIIQLIALTWQKQIQNTRN